MSPTKRARAAQRRALVLGIITLALFVGAYVLSLFSTNGNPFQERTQVKVAFTQVGSLRAGDDARIANARVGFVESIVLAEAADPNLDQSQVAVATLQLDNGRPVYRNATAIVDARSALGQKYVDINPGTPEAGLLPPEEIIPVSRTVSSTDLDGVFAELDEPTRDALGTFTRNLGGGLAGNGQELAQGVDAAPELLPDLGTVSEALAVNQGRDFASLLQSANSLALAFEGREEQIGQLIGKLDRTFAAINADGGQPLAQTLQVAPEALRQARGALVSLDQPLSSTRQAVEELRPGGRALGEATPPLREFLRESPEPLDKVPGVSDDAVPAIDGLTEVVADGEDLAPMLTDAFDDGGAITQALAPYAPEISLFFTNASDGFKFGNDNYRIARVLPIVEGTGSFSNALPFRDPTITGDPRPAPGEAAKQRRFDNGAVPPSNPLVDGPQEVLGR